MDGNYLKEKIKGVCMHYVLFGLLGFVFAYIGSEQYFSASIEEQEQALSTLSGTVDIILIPLCAVAIFALLKLFRNTKIGKKLLDLD